MKIPFLHNNDYSFPDPNLALKEPNGLLAVGGDLSMGRLLNAYRQGIFPWYEESDPIVWWSPDPRAILFFEDFIITKRFSRTLHSESYTIFLDRNFDAVITACQNPRPKQESTTWITPEMKKAYCALFEAGFCHCIEVLQENTLIGGIYGVSLGHAFFGESMFSFKSNGSKIALFYLIEKLKTLGFSWLDCQIGSPHLERLGAKLIPRSDFHRLLQAANVFPTILGPWTY
ncbi:MAG TPA: leucyl/phenylalanyl-tRNA--protein transferase [Gammaproteobacteria bacterium]|nr:leucyl/phenylalanyl-tRNA--protein transferase [Gammaproteobacteria bacterium]